MLVVVNNTDGNIRLTNENLTILIFDSGVGGLSIYKELKFLLPHVYCLYFFDNEVFPYGERSNVFILDRVINVFRAICKHHRLDLVIIACNTVTVVLLEKIRNYFFFPIIGIVPDIPLGLKYTRNGIVGLLATYKTINSKFILNIINRLSMSYRILLLSAVELVQLAEDKILNNNRVSMGLLCEILRPWLNILRKPDTIVLGCTHFLHLQYELQMIFPKGVYLIGSPKILAYHIVLFMMKKGMYSNKERVAVDKKVKDRVYCSVVTDITLTRWSSILYNYSFSSLQGISI